MIDSFHGQYRFLSNFWPAKVVLDGEMYSTVEHAYQASKTLHNDIRAEIRSLQSPGQAKRFARTFLRYPEWEGFKIDIMTNLVWQKFQHQILAMALAQTGTQELIEGNTWHDTFWGVCNGIGDNHLGIILMQVRDELANGYLTVTPK